MFVIKVLIGVLCAFSCCLISKRKADVYKEKVYYFNSLVLACEYLISDLMFKKRNLKEILSVSYPSNYFLETINDYFNGVESYPDFLTDEEVVVISEFFSQLGKGDSNSQINALKLYKSEFSKIRDDKKNVFDKNYKVTIKVGFSIGIMLFVLVI